MDEDQLKEFTYLEQWTTTSQNSTGFLKSTPKPMEISDLPEEIQDFIDEQTPHYNKMRGMRLRPT